MQLLDIHCLQIVHWIQLKINSIMIEAKIVRKLLSGFKRT